MIFTSGSTGEPKATMICHRSAVNLAFALGLRIYDEHPSTLRIGLNAPLEVCGTQTQDRRLSFAVGREHAAYSSTPTALSASACSS